MRLKIRTVAAAATAVGLVAAVSGALLVWMARGEGKWLVVVPVLMFAAVFVASRFFFNRFVAFRIKPIYQILLSKSVRTHELSQKADPVGHIEDELNRWAEKNAREIARLKENERYRKEFLGNVSHEIKTPIFTLQGYIVTLLDGAIEDKAVNRKYLERSEKNIDRLIHIVDDLEEISKLEAGAPVLEKECFDVVALVREIADSLEMDAARRRIGIRVGNPHGQPPVPVISVTQVTPALHQPQHHGQGLQLGRRKRLVHVCVVNAAQSRLVQFSYSAHGDLLVRKRFTPRGSRAKKLISMAAGQGRPAWPSK